MWQKLHLSWLTHHLPPTIPSTATSLYFLLFFFCSIKCIKATLKAWTSIDLSKSQNCMRSTCMLLYRTLFRFLCSVLQSRSLP
uniref:Uncharacterized protein n=1 Tax=Anguilla anguilla TaxID=7936 RepID=A0A0E9RDE3_ANGAN